MTGKALITSKTLWYNIFLALILWINREKQLIDPSLADPLAVAAITVGNAIMRSITREPVTGVLRA